jgi:hypothetical protein
MTIKWTNYIILFCPRWSCWSPADEDTLTLLNIFRLEWKKQDISSREMTNTYENGYYKIETMFFQPI